MVRRLKPIADVVHAHEHLALVDRTQADIGGELGTVLSQSEHRPAQGHRPGCGRGSEGRPQLRVMTPEAFGQQGVDRQTDEVGLPVSEQTETGRVACHDPALGVRDQHRIHQRLEQPVECTVHRIRLRRARGRTACRKVGDRVHAGGAPGVVAAIRVSRKNFIGQRLHPAGIGRRRSDGVSRSIVIHVPRGCDPVFARVVIGGH